VTAVRRLERRRASRRKWTGGHLAYLEVDGRPRKIWGFTTTLGYGRRTWAAASLDQRLGTLPRMHEAAFQC
jgi:hypothetical protein